MPQNGVSGPPQLTFSRNVFPYPKSIFPPFFPIISATTDKNKNKQRGVGMGGVIVDEHPFFFIKVTLGDRAREAEAHLTIFFFFLKFVYGFALSGVLHIVPS